MAYPVCLKVGVHGLAITWILDSMPPDGWFHLLGGEQKSKTGQSNVGSGSEEYFEANALDSDAKSLPGVNLELQCFLQPEDRRRLLAYQGWSS